MKMKKKYSVTTDELRKRFIELWNTGHSTIKQVSQELMSKIQFRLPKSAE